MLTYKNEWSFNFYNEKLIQFQFLNYIFIYINPTKFSQENFEERLILQHKKSDFIQFPLKYSQ